jgi:peptidoglycan-associated lipoprotein
MKSRLLILAALPLLALGFASCNNKNVKKGGASTTDMITDTVSAPTLEIQESTDTAGYEANLRGGEFISQENIVTVNFDYDSSALSDAARQALQNNAAILKTHKDWTVMVEGHCDQRGTIEYNLALGQKRAKEARDYYIRLGVNENSLGTISYGKEKPLCEEETDACWLKNRRAETKVRAR